MSAYTLYAITPPTAERVRHGSQNVGFAADFVHLLRTNLHKTASIQLFGGYRLWGMLPGGEYQLLEQCGNGAGVMYAGDPTCWRTPAGTANVEHHIAQVWSVQAYAMYLNWRDPQDQCGLVEDPNFWRAEYGITTAPQLADYLQGCHDRNMEKSALG